MKVRFADRPNECDPRQNFGAIVKRGFEPRPIILMTELVVNRVASDKIEFDIETLVAEADRALYDCKRSSKNCARIFNA